VARVPHACQGGSRWIIDFSRALVSLDASALSLSSAAGDLLQNSSAILLTCLLTASHAGLALDSMCGAGLRLGAGDDAWSTRCSRAWQRCMREPVSGKTSWQSCTQAALFCGPGCQSLDGAATCYKSNKGSRLQRRHLRCCTACSMCRKHWRAARTGSKMQRRGSGADGIDGPSCSRILACRSLSCGGNAAANTGRRRLPRKHQRLTARRQMAVKLASGRPNGQSAVGKSGLHFCCSRLCRTGSSALGVNERQPGECTMLELGPVLGLTHTGGVSVLIY